LGAGGFYDHIGNLRRGFAHGLYRFGLLPICLTKPAHLPLECDAREIGALNPDDPKRAALVKEIFRLTELSAELRRSFNETLQ
jgi:hypothetical protein